MANYLLQFGPIWSNLAKSLVFEILTSFSHKMNISENFEIFLNQILQDLLCVFIFGTILGPIWPNLALFVQVFSRVLPHIQTEWIDLKDMKKSKIKNCKLYFVCSFLALFFSKKKSIFLKYLENKETIIFSKLNIL